VNGACRFAAIAAIAIYVCIVLQTGSLFVGTMGFLHVLLSFPIAYTIFSVVLGIEWFAFLNWLGLFVVLGIGADDIFVFYDAWRQSFTILSPATLLEDRIAWVWARASMAMLITSATTSAAFLSNSVNPVKVIELFGWFMCILIAVNYILVITMFPAAVVVHHKYLRRLKLSDLLRRQSVPVSINASPGDGVTAAGHAVEGIAAEAPDASSRCLERFFAGVFGPMIVKTKYAFATVFTALTLVALMEGFTIDCPGPPGAFKRP
jgi:hypothetical protein